MVEIKQKKEPPALIADLEEIEDFVTTEKGVKTRLKVGGEWYILNTSTPVQLQNIIAPLEIGKQVEVKWRSRDWKGKTYFYINTIKPYNIVKSTLNTPYKPDEWPAHLEKEAKRTASSTPNLIEQLNLIKTELLLLETNTNTYSKFVVELCRAIDAKLKALQKQVDAEAFI